MSLLLAALLSGTDPLAPLAEPVPATRTSERLVRRGEPVTLRLLSGSLSITTAGRALGDGARSSRVRVVALSTRRTLEGIVEGPGEVRLIAP